MTAIGIAGTVFGILLCMIFGVRRLLALCVLLTAAFSVFMLIIIARSSEALIAQRMRGFRVPAVPVHLGAVQLAADAIAIVAIVVAIVAAIRGLRRPIARVSLRASVMLGPRLARLRLARAAARIRKHRGALTPASLAAAAGVDRESALEFIARNASAMPRL